MNQIPDYLYAGEDNKTWLILGASRGIGLEFVRQLLARGDRIIATVRETYAAHASALWGQAGNVSHVLSINRIFCCTSCTSEILLALFAPCHNLDCANPLLN